MNQERGLTLCDEFFRKITFITDDTGKPSYGTIRINRWKHEVIKVEVIDTGKELVEILFLESGQSLAGRRIKIDSCL